MQGCRENFRNLSQIWDVRWDAREHYASPIKSNAVEKYLTNGLCALDLKLWKMRVVLVDRNLAFLDIRPNPIPLTIGRRSEDRWFAFRT